MHAVLERVALWFRLPEPPPMIMIGGTQRGASRDRAVPGKRRRTARRSAA